jgi:3-hydroxyisobutyrate dehydrogenase
MADVTLLGVGRMGAAMARKLVEADHQVTLWNRTATPAAELANELGASVATSAADAVVGAQIVVSILSSGAVTEAVLLSPDVRAALMPGTVVCDMATSGVATAHALDAALTANGVTFVDAPVSGSVATIAAGALLVMASGSRDGVATVEPVMQCFAKRVAYLGPAGAGQAMKLCINLIVHTLNSAVSEGLALAESAGVDPAAAYDLFLDSVVAAPFVAYKRAAFLDQDVPVAMSLELTAKDLRLITAFASDQGVRATVVSAVSDEVLAACQAGFGEQDMAALFRYLGQQTPS